MRDPLIENHQVGEILDVLASTTPESLATSGSQAASDAVDAGTQDRAVATPAANARDIAAAGIGRAAAGCHMGTPLREGTMLSNSSCP